MSRRNAKPLPRMVVNGRQLNKGQIDTLKAAARAASAGDVVEARRKYAALERQIDGAAESEWRAQATAEVLSLCELKGEKVEISDKAEHKGRVRIKSRDGLEILRDAKRLNAAQFAAGERYREKYEAGRMETMPTSRYGARGGGSSDPEAASARRAHASAMVREWDNLARDHVAAIPGHKPCHAHDALFALHAVAGRGETINAISTSGGRRAALTERLVEALDVLADEMGLQ